MGRYHLLPLSAEAKDRTSHYIMPESLGFGKDVGPIMVVSRCIDGTWDQPRIQPYGTFSIFPSAKIFHYGQQIFEGMKAFRRNNGTPMLFRPFDHFKRFNRSAARMAMPGVPEEMFMCSIESLAHHLRDRIPQGEGESLYLRPFMIATEPGMSLSISNEFLYFALASPSGGYFSGDRVSVMIERVNARAAHGGTGCAKTAGNYAASLSSSIVAKKMGYQQTIWLDAGEHRFVEEFSGMNFFAVLDGELYTPELGTTILPGITRDSIIKLATHLGYKVHETKIDINELLKDIESGRCQEIFACGTAAIVTPLTELGENDGKRYPLRPISAEQSIARKLRTKLLQIQTGVSEDVFGWVHHLEAHH